MLCKSVGTTSSSVSMWFLRWSLKSRWVPSLCNASYLGNKVYLVSVYFQHTKYRSYWIVDLLIDGSQQTNFLDSDFCCIHSENESAKTSTPFLLNIIWLRSTSSGTKTYANKVIKLFSAIQKLLPDLNLELYNKIIHLGGTHLLGMCYNSYLAIAVRRIYLSRNNATLKRAQVECNFKEMFSFRMFVRDRSQCKINIKFD